MHCRDCQYDLSGLKAGPCPECGRRFDPADPASFAAESGFEHRWRQVKIGATLAVLLAALVVWCGVTDAGGRIWLLLPIAGVPGLLAFFGGIPLLRRPLSPRLVACSMIPAIVLVGAFYTLAIHMYLSLGGWPGNIGNAGFSSALNLHVEIAQYCVWLLSLVLFVTWPIAVVVFAVVRRWQAGIHYLGIVAISWALGFGLTELGPDGFLYWWWD
ncbi:MAG: hypothetical protein P8J59_00480 [Phycisphaerales bacterium]|jgi:rRNA maturation protein Nop10|nr:hypothetical protein [Phycisphaerales bacterium]